MRNLIIGLILILLGLFLKQPSESPFVSSDIYSLEAWFSVLFGCLIICLPTNKKK